MARTSRKARPDLEGLETRQLLNAGTGAVQPDQTFGSIPEVRTFAYRTAAGARVTVQIFGGNLFGTNVGADGGLNVVYSGTNAASNLVINVRGPAAPLDSVNELNLAPNDYTGVGGTLLGTFVAPKVDLVANGEINMTSGVGLLQLRTIGPNTQIHLRDLPPTVQPATTTSIATVSNSTTTPTTFSATSLVITGGDGRPVKIPAGENAVPIGAPPTPTAVASNSEAGKTLTYSNGNGASTLTSVTGYFVPTGNLITTPNRANPGTPPAPPGVIIEANTISGATNGQLTIGASQVWGYDPTANALIRFNTVTGAALQAIAVGGTPTNSAGVGLGTNGSELVVLLARGTTVQVFDASTGAALGGFSTADLAADGINAVDGVAYTGTTTILSDSSASVAYPNSAQISFGVAVSINVTSSLATGTAQVSGTPFFTDNGFSFAGPITGLAGSNSLFVEGGATLNSLEPTILQAGILTVTGAQSGTLKAGTPTALPNPNNTAGTTPFINLSPAAALLPGGGTSLTGLGFALGSIDQNLAVYLGVRNGQNTVGLYNPTNLSSVGTISLNDPNKLVDLSESFHPELAGTALIDVQGNVQSVDVANVNGLALNVNGNLNQIKFNNAMNSTVIGQPVTHVIIIKRNNVTIETPSRSIGNRNGVLIIPTLRPLGPLRLPT
jgi:hypothetical protein